jgi:hydroxymethylpyrimidine/phosphomethylpyrimidine kinase
MTEIALALAMGFFSIMVLTMVSMGAGRIQAPDDAERTAIAAALAPAAANAAKAARLKPDAEAVLVIYHRGRFYDRRLRVIDPAAEAYEGRVVLALDRALNMGEALAVRARVATPDLVVSTLDQRWTEALTRLPEEEE